MHELSIAESIIHTVEQERAARRLAAVRTIGVRVGLLSGVVPEALVFSFEAITRGTDLDGTRLAIERLEARGACRTCDHEFAVDDLMFVCPECFSGDVAMTRGDELSIAFLEVDR